MRKRSPKFYSTIVLCKGLGIETSLVEDVVSNKGSMYKMEERQIGEKKRPIYIARGNLRTFLRKLHLRLRRTEVDTEFFGGVRGRSVVDNAKLHAGSKYILNLDLKNFFPSVTTQMIRTVFRRELGCTSEMSKLLAGICTADNQLPQGFATSPLLSIFTLSALAMDLRPLLHKYGLQFTFWIDDLTISGGNNPRKLIPTIEKMCRRYELRLNLNKIHLGIRGKVRQEVTGVTINPDSLSPAPGYTRATTDMLHYAEKQGWEFVNDTFALDCESELKFLECMNGRIAWIERAKEKRETRFRENLGRLIAVYKQKTAEPLPPALLKLLPSVS